MSAFDAQMTVWGSILLVQVSKLYAISKFELCFFERVKTTKATVTDLE